MENGQNYSKSTGLLGRDRSGVRRNSVNKIIRVLQPSLWNLRLAGLTGSEMLQKNRLEITLSMHIYSASVIMFYYDPRRTSQEFCVPQFPPFHLPVMLQLHLLECLLRIKMMMLDEDFFN